MKRGFSIVELVMVVLLLAIILAVLIPNFFDFRKDAKNSATLAGVGMLRSVVAQAMAQISLKEDPTTRPLKFPSIEEMRKGVFLGEHPALSGNRIFSKEAGIPKNPWTLAELKEEAMVEMIECEFEKTQLHPKPELSQRGWCYRPSTGEVWANSNQNGAGPGKTENFY